MGFPDTHVETSTPALRYCRYPRQEPVCLADARFAWNVVREGLPANWALV
jgi:hypothetical protein